MVYIMYSITYNYNRTQGHGGSYTDYEIPNPAVSTEISSYARNMFSNMTANSLHPEDDEVYKFYANNRSRVDPVINPLSSPITKSTHALPSNVQSENQIIRTDQSLNPIPSNNNTPHKQSLKRTSLDTLATLQGSSKLQKNTLSELDTSESVRLQGRWSDQDKQALLKSVMNIAQFSDIKGHRESASVGFWERVVQNASFQFHHDHKACSSKMYAIRKSLLKPKEANTFPPDVRLSIVKRNWYVVAECALRLCDGSQNEAIQKKKVKNVKPIATTSSNNTSHKQSLKRTNPDAQATPQNSSNLQQNKPPELTISVSRRSKDEWSKQDIRSLLDSVMDAARSPDSKGYRENPPLGFWEKIARNASFESNHNYAACCEKMYDIRKLLLNWKQTHTIPTDVRYSIEQHNWHTIAEYFLFCIDSRDKATQEKKMQNSYTECQVADSEPTLQHSNHTSPTVNKNIYSTEEKITDERESTPTGEQQKSMDTIVWITNVSDAYSKVFGCMIM